MRIKGATCNRKEGAGNMERTQLVTYVDKNIESPKYNKCQVMNMFREPTMPL